MSTELTAADMKALDSAYAKIGDPYTHIEAGYRAALAAREEVYASDDLLREVLEVAPVCEWGPEPERDQALLDVEALLHEHDRLPKEET